MNHEALMHLLLSFGIFANSIAIIIIARGRR